MNEAQIKQPTVSKIENSMRVQALNDDNTISEDKDYPYRASEMRELRQPGQPIFQNEQDPNEIILMKENPIGEVYHMVKGAKQQPQRQSS